jgi:erythromycin esterase
LKKKLDNKEISLLINFIDNLGENSLIKENNLWFQFLQSFKSLILQYTSPKLEAYKIRDTQMANNLNFVAKTIAQEKIIVWAANAHISKLNQEFMDGKIMGSQFLQQSDRKTYHVAFATIKMPYRKSKFIDYQAKQSNNLLNLLPNVNSNSMIFSNLIDSQIPGIKLKKYIGMFGMGSTAFDYFEHFDALVFIASGEKVSY